MKNTFLGSSDSWPDFNHAYCSQVIYEMAFFKILILNLKNILHEEMSCKMSFMLRSDYVINFSVSCVFNYLNILMGGKFIPVIEM